MSFKAAIYVAEVDAFNQIILYLFFVPTAISFLTSKKIGIGSVLFLYNAVYAVLCNWSGRWHDSAVLFPGTILFVCCCLVIAKNMTRL
jgi:hypothetical protein